MADLQAKPKSRASLVVAVAVIVAGLLLISYPYISDWLAKQQQLNIVQSHEQAVQGASEKDLSAEIAKAKEYNSRLRLSRTRLIDPFDPDSNPPTDADYEAVMNLEGDGVMGTITIPKINVCLPIYHGTADEVLRKGAGHLVGTSVPIGGASTHSVLSGHTGLPQAKIFDNLDKLKKGDWFVLTVLGEDHAYRIYDTAVVLPKETESLAVEEGKDLVTLVTCTPYGVNTHRLLQHAERCEIPDEWLNGNLKPEPTLPPAMAELPLWAWGLIGAGVGAAIVIIAYVVRRKLRRA